VYYWPKQTISRVLFPQQVSPPRAMAIPLGPPLPTASSNQPGSTDGPSLTLPYLVLLLVGFTWHPTSPPDPVSSYLTLSPLPAFAVAPAGGLLSVALSLGSPPLDVIQRHALWSPDFPLPLRAAAILSASAKLYKSFPSCQLDAACRRINIL
jgi:hypothetical protein